MKTLRNTIILALAAAFSTSALADQVYLDDIIVDGSACIGQDCVNGESFGFDTLRLKENNLRIKFLDTSSTASFPTQDWQLTANDSSNGGLNKFSIDAISPSSTTPFTIEAGAPSHSLYVDDGGRIGLGTSTPVVELHVKDGDTPTLRLEQDGSSGFTPQTWDVAGNETNFFVRDATGGSALPFRIQPGAGSNVLYLANDEQIGVGTTSPGADLHISHPDSDNFSTLRLTNPQGASENWDVRTTTAGGFAITKQGTGQVEFEVDVSGNVTIRGDVNIIGTCSLNGVPGC